MSNFLHKKAISVKQINNLLLIWLSAVNTELLFYPEFYSRSPAIVFATSLLAIIEILFIIIRS